MDVCNKDFAVNIPQWTKWSLAEKMFSFTAKSMLSSWDQRAEVLWAYCTHALITLSLTQMLNLGSNKVEVVDGVYAFVSRMRLSENTRYSVESLLGV